MSTENFELELIQGSDDYSYSPFNDNMRKIDAEMAKPPLTVNGVDPDAETRNIQLTTVPLADNLTSDEAQINTGTYIARTSGGEASIANGTASLNQILGFMRKTGYVEESIVPSSSNPDLSVSVDRDTFVGVVTSSQTITLTYTTGWSTDPATYGITVTGSPSNGDTITVVYTKGSRGTITPAFPTSFISTGWNLYNHVLGCARVVNYSDDYGFKIEGTYTALEFGESLSTPVGERESITPVNGYFTVPADGYVFVTGGNGTDTAIWMTWSDWTEDANGGVFEAYTQDVIDLSGLMVNFPYGLMKVGNIADEINFNTQKMYSRVTRYDYSDETLESIIASGVPYDTDTNYIYAARVEAVTYNISLDATYDVSDHGMEIFNGTSVPLTASSIYGQDLKNKLRRDVLTISQQTLSPAQKSQVLENIGAASAAALGIVGETKSKLESSSVSVPSSTNTHLSSMVLNKGVYILQAVASFAANGTGLRQLYFSLTRAGSLLNRFCTATNASVASGAITRISLTSILEVTQDNTTIYLVGNQTSGGTLSVDGIGIQAVRIK